MYIGILKIKIRIDSAFSLKDKRKIIVSTKERLKAKFNLSIAEVEDQDIYNLGTLGISVVSGDYSYLIEVLEEIILYLEEDFRFEILSIDKEIL